MSPRARSVFGLALSAALAALATAACSQGLRSTLPREPTPQEMAEFWVEPEDITARNLFDGPGGPALRPKPGSIFRFESKDTKWYSWGWDVEDANGMEWSAKYGPEARSEVTVSRLVWAVGYHQPATYYVEHWSLTGSKGEDGPKTPCRFRPDPPGRKNVGYWRWEKNPFVGTRPFGGLIALMRIVNNWDLLDRNNTIYEFKEPVEGVRRWYVVKDLGAALGKTSSGGPLSGRQGSKNDIDGFEKQDFIRAVKGDRVEFDDSGFRNRHLYRDIKVADVRWVCERLNRLTPAQWKDAFRAANYPDDVADRFIRKIKEKVAYGLSLPAGS